MSRETGRPRCESPINCLGFTNRNLAPAGETAIYLDPDQSEGEDVGGDESAPAPGEQPESNGDDQVSEDAIERHDEGGPIEETMEGGDVVDENDLRPVCHSSVEFVASPKHGK